MDTRKAVKTYHRNLAIVLAIIVAIFAAIPLVVDKPYIINIFVLTFYMSTLSMAWNILGGITGQNSLGLAAYMGLGAYVCCLVVTKTGMNLGGRCAGYARCGRCGRCHLLPQPDPARPLLHAGVHRVCRVHPSVHHQLGVFRPRIRCGPALRQGLLCAVPLYQQVPYYYIGFIMMVGVYLIMKKIGRSSWLCAAHHPRG